MGGHLEFLPLTVTVPPDVVLFGGKIKGKAE
jgi:hypothetical protein